ncbi:MAG: hypothetical protein WBC70_02835, partial [Candidatus Aminicenantales bacterium]
MKINRIVIGWALFALVLVILAVVVIIPAFLAGPADAPDASRAKSAALSRSPFSASAPAASSAFLSVTFPADDPTRDSLPPSLLPVVIIKGSDYDMGFQYGEQAGAYID